LVGGNITEVAGTKVAERGFAFADDDGVEERGVGVCVGQLRAAGDKPCLRQNRPQDTGDGFDKANVPEINGETDNARMMPGDLLRNLYRHDIEVGLQNRRLVRKCPQVRQQRPH